jgi:hypothetical protein
MRMYCHNPKVSLLGSLLGQTRDQMIESLGLRNDGILIVV